MTQTDRNVCRWLADHRKGDPVRGRAGEGEEVTQWAGAVRYARGGEPKQHYPSSELCSDVVTGERPEIERLMGSFGGGPLEKGRKVPRWWPTLLQARFGEGDTPYP
jgi:hypothetical protein